MLGLTRQERQVVLFLLAVGLVGQGINFSAKLDRRIEKAVTVGEDEVKIDINRASLEDLLATHLMPQKLSRKIIEFRNVHGPFRELAELKEVKGIGDYRYEKLKEIFYVR
jgi:competence protein ComEA